MQLRQKGVSILYEVKNFQDNTTYSIIESDIKADIDKLSNAACNECIIKVGDLNS